VLILVFKEIAVPFFGSFLSCSFVPFVSCVCLFFVVVLPAVLTPEDGQIGLQHVV
jgi:hypothetical protein